MELVLHVVDEEGFVNLAGVAEPGTHYTAARNENTGVVRLTPVKVATTVRKLHDPYNSLPLGVQVEGQTTEAPWTS